VNAIDAYAHAVAAKKVPAGKYHRLACVRHLEDLKRQSKPKFPYTFSLEHADRFFRFAGKMKHYKGEWAGRPFEPSPVQVFRLGSIFGWRRNSDGRRRFTTAYNDMPRKHGKSFEGGVVLNYGTFFEGEPGAEGYCIANKEQQAGIVFGNAKTMVVKSGLAGRIKVSAKNLYHEASESFARPLGRDSDTQDGLNPQVVVIDEPHAMKNRGLIDVMEQAAGARLNPLFFWITTHGKDIVSPWGDQLMYAKQILDGVLDDDPSTVAFFAFIAGADKGDDPFAEKTMIKANPHWGISVYPDDMRQTAAKASKMPSAAAEYKQKRLNMLPEASAQWLSMEGWHAGQSEWDESELLGQSCWIGIDLASKIDLCAMVAVFPPTGDRKKWRLLRWVWTPEDTLDGRAHRDRAPYRVWKDAGYLITQDGKSLNHNAVRLMILEQRSKYRIQQIGFDPWQATDVINDLKTQDGLSDAQVVEVPQKFQYMSTPSLEYEAAVLEGLVDARGCPLMAWCNSNVVVQRDGKDNVQPIKKRSRGRIDPVVATIIGWSLAIRGVVTDSKPRSKRAKFYSPEGFRWADTGELCKTDSK
jgi:phage terminase large subunit-like protein